MKSENLTDSEVNTLIDNIRNLVSTYMFSYSPKTDKTSSMNELKIPLDNMVRNLGYIKEMQVVLEDPTKNLTPKQKSILNLFVYLSIMEGMISEIANMIIFMLLQSGGIKKLLSDSKSKFSSQTAILTRKRFWFDS
jgi:hypothetical protein